MSTEKIPNMSTTVCNTSNKLKVPEDDVVYAYKVVGGSAVERSEKANQLTRPYCVYMIGIHDFPDYSIAYFHRGFDTYDFNIICERCEQGPTFTWTEYPLKVYAVVKK